MEETTRRCAEGIVESLTQDTRQPLSSQYEKPDTHGAAESHRSRFRQT